MAGASIPLTRPCTRWPPWVRIVRYMDVSMYERQSREAMEVGSYAHRPILVRPDDILSLADAERSPVSMSADFEVTLPGFWAR